MYPCTETLATTNCGRLTIALVILVVSQIQVGCASTNKQADYVGPALHVAARNGDWRTVARLIADGADVNTRDGVGMTALHRSAAVGAIDAMKSLIQHNAEIDARDHRMQTPLHKAAVTACGEAVRLLLDHGADVNAEDQWGNTPVAAFDEVASMRWKGDRLNLYCLACAGFLLHPEGDTFGSKSVGEPGACGQFPEPPPLHSAALCYGVEEIEELLAAGADVDVRDAGGGTALHLLAAAGSASRVDLFIRRGADVNAQDMARQTPLHLAASEGHLEACRLLIDNGAHVDGPPDHCGTPLDMLASGRERSIQDFLHERYGVGRKGDYPRTAGVLIRAGARIGPGAHGYTPLHLAASSGYVDVAKVLLRHGADKTAKTDTGATPCSFAEQALWEEQNERQHNHRSRGQTTDDLKTERQELVRLLCSGLKGR